MTQLNQLIIEANRLGRLITISEELVPTTLESAYQTQNQILELCNGVIGAWKVGTGDHANPVFASPIPNEWVYSNQATIAKNRYSLMGIELEYAFKLNNINQITATMTLSELENHISEVAAAIEIVSTRLNGWPDLPPYLKAADLQSNGALIVGQSQPYCAYVFNFNDPIISLTDNQVEKSTRKGKNPAGDPRLLIPTFIEQQRQFGRQVNNDHWITTGSLSGIFFIDYATNITGTIEGLPSIHLKVE
jgi:2-keto-4-pentenoate hydratase